MSKRAVVAATGALAAAVAVFASDVAGPGAKARNLMTTRQVAQKTPARSMAIPRIGWESTAPRGPRLKAGPQAGSKHHHGVVNRFSQGRRY